jgi:hypothetical protein
MARVQVADDVWADFRAAAGHRPLSEVLGELVTREVDRYRSRRLRAGRLDPREITEALAYAAQQQADLAVIVERLERLERLNGGEARGDAINRATADVTEDTAFTDAAAAALARTNDRA